MAGRLPLAIAQERMRRWLREQGLRRLADGDITVEVGSGQSRPERQAKGAGRLVELLRSA